MVEFALVLVPLLLLLVGFLQLGLAMNAKIDSTHLTAEGARYIAVNQNPGDPGGGNPAGTMQEYIRSRAGTAALKTAKVCIEYPLNTVTNTSRRVGDPVRVTMSRPYGLDETSGIADLVPGGGLPTSVTVSGETTMRLEALPTKIDSGCTA